MATTIRMRYNPYLSKLELTLLDKKGNEQELEGSARDIVCQKFGNTFVLEDSGNELLDILSTSYRNSRIQIDFVGSQHHFGLMQKLCSARDNITVSVSAQQRILSCDEIQKIIINKVAELKEAGFDIDSEGEIDRILDATIPVVVVGNMSAGKSTFLNSLIGDELLPSGTDATTGVICELHNSKSKASVSYISYGKNVEIDCSNSGDIIGNKNISEELKQAISCEATPFGRIRAVINFFNFKDKQNSVDRTLLIDGKLIKIECPFFNAQIPEEIVFYDTPGNGSDTNKDDETTLQNALKNQTKGFIIFVCDGRSDLDKSQELIDTVIKNAGNKLDIAHTIVICNQTEEEPDGKVITSTEKEWASRIIYTSSAVALGVRKPLSKKENWKEERLFKVFAKNRGAFSDPENECYVSLPQYCTLPFNRSSDINDIHTQLTQKMNVTNDIETARKKLMEFNSGITIAERELIFVAKELFPYNQCERARTVFLELLKKYKTIIEEKESEKETQKQDRIEEFNEIYEPLCVALSNVTDKFITTQKEEYSSFFSSAEYSYKTKKAEEFAVSVKDTILSADSYEGKTEGDIQTEVIGVMSQELVPVRKSAEYDFQKFLLGPDALTYYDSASRKICLSPVLPEFALKCVEVINSQSDISESEKEVFKSFFTVNQLEDRTKEEREKSGESLKLDIPQFLGKRLGDKWYSSFWKSLVNTSKKVGYWFEKNFGEITENLIEFYQRSYQLYTNDLLVQFKENLSDIFKKIKDSFSGESSDNSIICELHPKLGEIKKSIALLNDEIVLLGKKKDRIESELTGLENIFSKIEK